MTILAIDTSNYTLGIALLRDNTVIAEYITYLKKNHSVRAMPAVHSLLNDCDLTPQDLSKIVVAKGPGSYTGVRIGVTIAKTLAWSLNIPISAVSSLEALAANGRHFDGLISPIFDARRGQVYTGLYEYKNGLLEQAVPDQNVMLTEWLEMLKEKDRPVLFLGHDTSIHKETILDVLGTKGVIGPAAQHNPRPSELAYAGADREAVDIHGLVPDYLRLAEAEAKWIESQK
ncbi:tRNA (adenosine(37)-N6)-threonylcarbamoyltransferase complex dimerization subunit type 1 TsaB [Bacillus mojavensis]|jgi:tRNA threonylcarbamoyladenosine biosynthesis protein TsaB|uniref:tRNA (Adenosine(37)-N6)-threonylcarbamoyltransferase complex dimerization subunit type 1 TsaB n=1 Tax=Bacillus mojavensis TaxID=72360 RepID=A0AAP3G1X4_BACMO|nr:tRNA (adenosine(37)-N6)-threonylcarbamoyltransferase complex dimerization subunit type 1 TsaB [Bacillus mojavensis]MCY8104757.1 tRNA (adenosine(37)-N6)-threonylcarbamoyltransferase complex dimerization subunit type 1 TsaB [Bacillus mojavensis]MCY8482146.1 tRNA (adenosine(37)-N6)-threonylcarbamoyltransferase complex dimerization subunit type 1 TsaB [Bacillus mojavensis]MCY8510322.1 tRNA (adenosine(37)-N6)-threonylcarbamoyltransferase complex dimerization subunit type 1 TsaB [Bacillus mojavensi